MGLPPAGTYDTPEGIMKSTDTCFGGWADPKLTVRKDDIARQRKGGEMQELLNLELVGDNDRARIDGL